MDWNSRPYMKLPTNDPTVAISSGECNLTFPESCINFKQLRFAHDQKSRNESGLQKRLSLRQTDPKPKRSIGSKCEISMDLWQIDNHSIGVPSSKREPVPGEKNLSGWWCFLVEANGNARSLRVNIPTIAFWRWMRLLWSDPNKLTSLRMILSGSYAIQLVYGGVLLVD